jgi:hypothetical protein
MRAAVGGGRAAYVSRNAGRLCCWSNSANGSTRAPWSATFPSACSKSLRSARRWHRKCEYSSWTSLPPPFRRARSRVCFPSFADSWLPTWPSSTYLTGLEEIIEIGDFVTVLRDGRLVAEAAVPDIDAHWIIERMIGHDPETLFPHESRPVGAALLEVSDVSLLRPGGNHRLDRVRFSVAAGEIVGLYGLMGAGRTELLETLVGLQPRASGQVVVDGAHVEHKSVGERISRGLFLVPEDRQRGGLVQSLSVKQNISLASLDSLQTFGSLLGRREVSNANRVATAVGVKVARHRLSSHIAVWGKPTKSRRCKGAAN